MKGAACCTHKYKEVVEHINHEIPVDEQFDLHKKGWKIQRGGWVFMLLIIVLSIAGLFGMGPVSTVAKHQGDFDIQYERFNRYESETEIKIRSGGQPINVVALPQAYIEKFQVQSITPEPADQIAEDGYIKYFFNGAKNHSVVFYLSPSAFGNTKGTVKINSTDISLQQFIYP